LNTFGLVGVVLSIFIFAVAVLMPLLPVLLPLFLVDAILSRGIRISLRAKVGLVVGGNQNYINAINSAAYIHSFTF
jgi:hypothetical protein